jgi:hypothetical protein
VLRSKINRDGDGATVNIGYDKRPPLPEAYATGRTVRAVAKEGAASEHRVDELLKF